jgi:hypothetical protein
MIGLNSAMAGIAAMAAAPATTWLARRLSVVTTMVLAIVAAAASALGFYFAEALWMWFPLRIVFHGAITILFVLVGVLDQHRRTTIATRAGFGDLCHGAFAGLCRGTTDFLRLSVQMASFRSRSAPELSFLLQFPVLMARKRKPGHRHISN